MKFKEYKSVLNSLVTLKKGSGLAKFLSGHDGGFAKTVASNCFREYERSKKMTSQILSVHMALCVMIASITINAHSQSVTDTSPPHIVISSGLMFTWNTGTQGWEATNDFKLDSSFRKLGGPFDKNAWVTENPVDHQTYTSGANADSEGYISKYPGPNVLTSPWFSRSNDGDTVIYLSFEQSIQVEPGWDGSWMEYTTDGVHWKHLGKLNDPDGSNWYATSSYNNAQTLTGDPPDTATMSRPGYTLFGPVSSNPALPFPWWTSNGTPSGNGHSRSRENGRPEGPIGWMRCQLAIRSYNYPDIYSSLEFRIRYVAFADAVNPVGANLDGKDLFQGWAIDNFSVSNRPPK